MSSISKHQEYLQGIASSKEGSINNGIANLYGKTIGKPQLSEEAAEYYRGLKDKYSNMDFILVSQEMKAYAQANASNYANPNKMVVLIDEDKIERMAADEEYRKQYESIIAYAASDMSQMMNSVNSSDSIVSYGVKINDDGTASYFAVVDKILASQRERIEKKAVENREEKLKNERKEEKEESEEFLEEKITERKDEYNKELEKIREKLNKIYSNKRAEKTRNKQNEVTVSARTIEELINKINDITYAAMSDNVKTQQEKMVGQYVDLKL